MKVFDSLNAAMTNQVYINDIVANNLANVSSGGFKKTLTALVTRQGVLYPEVVKRLDDAPGPVAVTDNPLDLAIDGKGYFAVEAGGETRYTRNGSFKLNGKGELVTQSGYRVLGEKGPVVIRRDRTKQAGQAQLTEKDRVISVAAQGERVNVNARGEIYMDGTLVDRLRLVTIPAEKATQAEGSALISAPKDAVSDAFQGQIRQYYLENSNVAPVEEMVNMVDKLRIFQTLGKSVQTQDDLYAKSVGLNSRS